MGIVSVKVVQLWIRRTRFESGRITTQTRTRLRAESHGHHSYRRHRCTAAKVEKRRRRARLLVDIFNSVLHRWIRIASYPNHSDGLRRDRRKDRVNRIYKCTKFKINLFSRHLPLLLLRPATTTQTGRTVHRIS